MVTYRAEPDLRACVGGHRNVEGAETGRYHEPTMIRGSSLVSMIATLTAFAASAHGQPVTTIITHGYSLDATKGPWIEGMADAIIARVATGGGAVLRYDQGTGAWQLISGTIDSADPVCLIYRWLEDFDKPGPNWGFAEAAADALYAALRDPAFIDGGGTPLPQVDLIAGRHLHFLGHSRGTVVNSETVERLALAGIAVDHVTTFDPHPLNGTLDPPVNYDWGDPVPRFWTNVAFHDNYWRADGGLFNAFDPDGIPIPGALNLQFSESVLNSGGYSNAHSDTHLWYHGTIDLAPTPCDGEQCITQTMRSSWWPDGYTEIGYYLSQIGGGAAMRPAQMPPDAPGTPGPVPSIYGGDFAMAAQAGWQFHGGQLGGAIVSDGGATFLRLSAADGISATHNRFFLPAGSGAIVLSHRIVTADAGDADDVLRAELIDRDGVTHALNGVIDLTGPAAGWVAGASFGIPAGVPRDRTCRLRLSIDGGAQVHATVGLDDIAIAIAVCAADVNDDGSVSVTDLLELLAAWGPCPPPCPADLDGDGDVTVADLLALLAAWGACP